MKSFEISARTVSSTNSLPELVTDENTLNMGVDYALTDKQVKEIGTLVAGRLGIKVLAGQMIAHRSWVSSKPDKWVRHLTLGK